MTKSCMLRNGTVVSLMPVVDTVVLIAGVEVGEKLEEGMDGVCTCDIEGLLPPLEAELVIGLLVGLMVDALLLFQLIDVVPKF